MVEDIPSIPKQGRVYFVMFMLVFLLCLAVGVAGYFYYQYKHITPPANEVEEITKLTQEIGALIELPGDEVPTLATVTDREKLTDQPFFQKAQNGDKVLIYTNGGRAILYRPSIGKIVDVTSVNVANNQPTEELTETMTSQETPEEELTPKEDTLGRVEVPKIALYNGTTKRGLTQKQEEIILKGFGEVSVLEKETANSTDYKKTLVVDVSGKYPELIASLAKKYRAVLGSLPEGERETTADILIIFGEDQL